MLVATLAVIVVAGIGAWILAHRLPRTAQNPLANAQFARLTDFDGAETNPAISPDGKFVAFISDRSGTFDIWLIQANGGSLANLTQGRIGDARGPLRAIGFSGDGSEVWSSGTESRRLRLIPLVGGAPHNFLGEHAAEVAWSPDGARLVYHTWEPGDPTFVADHNGANERQIVKNEPGLHNHFQVWSKDGRWIYFARGRPATHEMDLWRISPDGGEPERLTHLNTDVAYPSPIDERTVLFVAHDENGAGPWLWAFDVNTRTSQRVSSGLEQYTALAATADGRRLAASVVNSQFNLWSVPITDRIVEEREVEALPLPTVRAHAPRFGGGSLFYLSSRDGSDGLWSYRDGQALEIWKGAEGALQSPAAVSADGSSVAFALRRDGKRQMHVMAADGTELHPLSSEVDVRGTASWSPDGKWIVAAGSDRNGPGLFKFPADDGPPVRIATGPFLDPVWSPRGDLIVYGGTQVFTQMPLLAVHPDGTPAKLPEINVQRDGERARFLPDGTGLVYMLGNTTAGQDFWLLDLGTMRPRRLTHLSNPSAMRTFDITSDGRRIVFDRLRENSDILLIDLATKQARPYKVSRILEQVPFGFHRELHGGGRGIRTPGTLSGTAVFKTARFNRSRIPPHELRIAWGGCRRSHVSWKAICTSVRAFGLSNRRLVMYKTKPMKRLHLSLALVLLVGGIATGAGAQTTAKPSNDGSQLAARTAGLQKHDGFFPYYWDEKKGDILFELSPAALRREFLYFTGLGSGIGSIETFADRSSFGAGAVCRFRRVGMRVLVIEENTSFLAPDGTPELKHSVEYSFPTSVLASLPVEAEQDGTVLVDADALLIRDAFDLLSQLRRPTHAVGGVMVREASSKAADWRLDKDRSVIDLEHTGSFPLNTEVEALLTFATDSESDLNQPDSHSLSVREHHSFVAMPAPGYEPLDQDPRVGFISVSFQDFSQPYDRPLTRYLVERWRLQKKDPKAALSEPVKPIVFYLDRAIPEPVRSAARMGALWWNQAFEQAGFKNALRVEDLPEGADPMDIRYPTIQWTNRSGRGWSVGQSHVDPRTGEIIHAVVQLDSHRMRTMNNYWESVMPSGRDSAEPALDTFAALDNLDPRTSEEHVMLQRLALLTCHEMGHVLGLDHNFVASTYGRGSVMDYFAPRVQIRADGTADLSDAYMQGTGSYDRFAIEWGYSQGNPDSKAPEEQARRDAIVKGAIAKGNRMGQHRRSALEFL